MNSMLSLIWGLFIHWENLRFSIFVHKKKTKEEKDHIILTNKKIKKKKKLHIYLLFAKTGEQFYLFSKNYSPFHFIFKNYFQITPNGP